MKNLRRIVEALLLISILFSGAIHAQSVDEISNKFIKRYHTFQGTTLPYYLFMPLEYHPPNHYPLVLCLHGSGESGDNLSAVKNNSMATVWARDSNQVRWPCFILVPQCPGNGWWTYSNITLTVMDILDSLQREFSLDANRLYVTGLSMGGYGTWDIIVRYPARFAAAIPMSGGGDPSKAFLIKHIPIWDFHGAKDATVSVMNSRVMMTALENTGELVLYTHCHNGDCTGISDSALAEAIRHHDKFLYTEYENGGHLIWDQAYNTFFLLPWVFSQSLEHGSTGAEWKSFVSLPKKASLSQNYPNPFNPSTEIRYSVVNYGMISLRVYDLLGREVATLVHEEKPAGTYTVLWYAAGDLPSGVYFYRLTDSRDTRSKKLLLLR